MLPPGTDHRRSLPRLTCLASPAGGRLLQALFLLWEVEARLRLTGFARLRTLLDQWPTAEPRELTQARIDDARNMARAILRASQYFPRARCLHRSLALLLWLRRRAIRAELRLGVRAGEASTEGHAWVEWCGVLLNDERAGCDNFSLLERARASGAGLVGRSTETNAS